MGIESLVLFAVSAAFQVISTRNRKQEQDRARRKAEAEADKRRGFFIPVRGEVGPLPIIYGKQIIGGTELNHRVRSSITPAVTAASNAFKQPEDFSFEGGTHNAGKNSYLMFNTALCNTQGTRIESVEDILVNSTTYKYQKKKFTHNFYVHYSGGTAEPLDTANGQPATNKFTNCAYSTNIFKLNRKEPQYSGIPRLQFLVKGNHIRTFDDLGGGSYGISGYKEYSNNRVEVLFDYLTAPYGAGLLDSQIEIDSFGRAAGIAGVVAMSDQQFGGGVNGLGPLREYGTLSGFPTKQSLKDQDYFGHPSGSTIYKAVDTGKFYKFVSEIYDPIGSLNPIDDYQPPRGQEQSWGIWDQYGLTSTQYYALLSQPVEEIGQYVEISAPRKDVYRFEGNLTIDPSQSVRDNIESILSGIPFADLVWTNDGKYRLVMNYPDTDAELEALINADNTFGDDDILRVGSIQEEFGQAAQRFNRVTVDFNNEFENFASDSISWPERGSTVHNTYLAEDNNKIYESTITSDATTPYHAMAEAEQTVRISRDSNNLEITLGRKGLRIEPGDFFRIDSELTNAPNGIWKAEEVEIRVDFSVKVKATLVTANMFAWNVPDDIPYTSQPVFDFTISKPTNLQASTGVEFFKGAVSNSYVDLTWDTVYNDASYLIEYKKVDDVLRQTATSVSNSVRIPSLDGGKDYHAIVKTILTSGLESEPTHIAFTSGVDSTFPKPPQNLVATAEGTVIDLTWDEVTQNIDNSPLLDFKEYQIYRSVFANPTTLVGTEVGSKFTDSNRLPNTLYNYRVCAVDTQGNSSAYSDNIQVTSQAPVTSGITSNAVYVTQGQIIYNPNAGTYSDTFLDIDVIFIKAGLTVARNRYRLSRSGNTWSAPVTDRSADIPDEVNVGFITPSVSVNDELATVTFQFNDGTSIALISLPFVIVSSGIGGSDGENGLNSAIVLLFQKLASGSTPPPKPTGTFNYTFSTADLTGGNLNGWSKLPPSLNPNEELWVTRATASATTATNSLAGTEFSNPVVESSAGQDGINTAFVTLYAKNTTTTPPADPTGDLTYNFNTGVLTGILGNWAQTAPSLNAGEYLFAIQATAASRESTDIINTAEFSAASVVGMSGSDGEDGPVGARGPGRWNIPVTSLPTSAYTAQTRWNSDLNTPTPPISSDQAWFYTGAQASPTSQSVWIYTGSTWVKQDEVIDGNLLVSDTLTADKISIGDGSLSSDGSGKLIVKGGNITQLEDNLYRGNLPMQGINFLQLVGGATLDIPPAYNADVQIAVNFEHVYSNLVADNDAWGYKIEAGSPYVLMDVSCGFMNSLSSYTILDLGSAGQANWNALDGTVGQTKSVGSTISTTNIIDIPVTSVISGVTYIIKSLGSTSQGTWNNMAGTAGLLYNPGDLFSATTAGTGTGTVDIYQGDGKVRGTGYHVMKQRLLSPIEQETDYVTVVSVLKDLENIRSFNGNPAEALFSVFVYWMGESGDIELLDCISSIFVRFK